MSGKATKTQAERFWAKVTKTKGCWLWTGCVMHKGYGQFNPGGRSSPVSAHRVSWEMHYGPIPEGLMVLHDCPGGDNPRCVNPDHLWLGTAKQNSQDMVAKGRASGPKGSKNHSAVMTEKGVREMRQLHRDGRSARSLARQFGIGSCSAYKIIHRKTYAWLD